ncbi:MAG: hypothetical protein ABIQ52_13555 [Vicinamibacterales bacterium]
MFIHLIVSLALTHVLAAAQTPAQTPQAAAVPADSSRWQLAGDAKAVDYQGRKTLRLNGGLALLDGFDLRDGVIDVDVSTPAARGFFGIQFRLDQDANNGEWIYLRQHKSGQPDALQYTPVLRSGLNWQIYNGPGFTGPIDVPRNEWFHLRLAITGAQAKLYVKDMEKPALVMDDLKSGRRSGRIALAALTGETYFANFEAHLAADTAWERHLPAMPAGTLTRWRVSEPFDALKRNPEQALSDAERKRMKWTDVEAEAPGLVVLYRYYDAPHLRVSFANDFSKRLEPQPGSELIYAAATMQSDRAQVKRLAIGYSDEVTVFLNGQILYRGRSAQHFRDPGFLGIVNPENDAVYLPLRAGSNELVLAVTELGGGWGFICRVMDLR